MLLNMEDMKKIYRLPWFQKMVFIYILTTAMLAGCGAEKAAEENTRLDIADKDSVQTEAEDDTTAINKDNTSVEENTGIASETAEDAVVDIKVLQEENSDIFAWLYIPGTDIDCPVLQSIQADDFYENHNAFDEADEEGAVYIELANLTNMCDFNTVLHGKTSIDGESGLFADLYQFAAPDFFEKHKTAYLYLDGNLLTYEIFAAYERENTSLLRTYDFTYLSGCQAFLDDLYGTRVMGMNFREGWEDLTPYHFLITLTTERGDNSDEQFVVLGGLINDAAGTIDRVIYE